jgi:hypothetical protein
MLFCLQMREAEGHPCRHHVCACKHHYGLSAQAGGQQKEHDVYSPEFRQKWIHAKYSRATYVKNFCHVGFHKQPNIMTLDYKAEFHPPDKESIRGRGSRRIKRFASVGERAMGKKGGVSPKAKKTPAKKTESSPMSKRGTAKKQSSSSDAAMALKHTCGFK